MKAMILAAGRGKRMRPLTDETPKALLEVAGKPLIVYQIERLQKAGIHDVIINLAHCSEKIRTALGDGSRFQMQITYSNEPEGAYETGGGIIKALPLLGSEPFIVINCDLWTDYPLKNLPTDLPGLAHLVMVDNPEQNQHGDFTLNNGQISEGGTEKLTFAGIAVYHPDLFKDEALRSFSILPLIRKAIELERITGEYYQGTWININSIDLYNNLRQKHSRTEH